MYLSGFTGILFVYICLLQDSSSTPACFNLPPESKVFGACNNGNGKSMGNSKLYLDTGTAANNQVNRCKCDLSLLHGNITIRLQYENSTANGINHPIEVANLILNSSILVVDFPLHKNADLWIKTDGVGGVCVSMRVYNKVNEGESFLSIMCSSKQYATTTKTETSYSMTTNESWSETTTFVKSGPTTTHQFHTYSGQDKVNLIGPVAGGVGGFILVAVAIISIYCLRKRRMKHKETRADLNKSGIVQPHDNSVDKTAKLVANTDVDDKHTVSIDNDNNDHVKSIDDMKKAPLQQTRAENDCRNASDLDNKISEIALMQEKDSLVVYSAVNKRPKLLKSTTHDSDDVYDRTDISEEVMEGTEDYDRLGTFQAGRMATEDVYDSTATNTGNKLKRNVQGEYGTAYRKP